MKRYVVAAVVLMLSLAFMASCTSTNLASSLSQTSSGTTTSSNPNSIISASATDAPYQGENSEVSSGAAANSATADPVAFAGHFSPDSPTESNSSVLNLDTDGSFHLTVNLLDTMGNLYGTYTLVDNMVTLNVTEKDFGDSYVNADTNPILLTVIDIDTLTWESAYLGDTLPGETFHRY